MFVSLHMAQRGVIKCAFPPPWAKTMGLFWMINKQFPSHPTLVRL